MWRNIKNFKNRHSKNFEPPTTRLLLTCIRRLMEVCQSDPPHMRAGPRDYIMNIDLEVKIPKNSDDTPKSNLSLSHSLRRQLSNDRVSTPTLRRQLSNLNTDLVTTSTRPHESAALCLVRDLGFPPVASDCALLVSHGDLELAVDLLIDAAGRSQAATGRRQMATGRSQGSQSTVSHSVSSSSLELTESRRSVKEVFARLCKCQMGESGSSNEPVASEKPSSEACIKIVDASQTSQKSSGEQVDCVAGEIEQGEMSGTGVKSRRLSAKSVRFSLSHEQIQSQKRVVIVESERPKEFNSSEISSHSPSCSFSSNSRSVNTGKLKDTSLSSNSQSVNAGEIEQASGQRSPETNSESEVATLEFPQVVCSEHFRPASIIAEEKKCEQNEVAAGSFRKQFFPDTDDATLLTLSEFVLLDFCCVCISWKSRPFFQSLAACDCRICTDCLRQYYRLKIQDGDVLDMLCPGLMCRRVVPPAEVLDVVGREDPEIRDKFLRFRRLRALSRDPNCRWCPRPGCDQYIIGSASQPCLQCPRCSTPVCFHCGAEWHPRQSCEERVDAEYSLWVRSHGVEVQKCPGCRSIIEKNGGCNAMKCSACKIDFCWLCGRRIRNSAHFATGNFLGCPGGLFVESNRSTGDRVLSLFCILFCLPWVCCEACICV
eukprot:747727_1